MPDNSIDSLQIELKASSQSASKSIMALESKIKDLSTALSGINTTRLSNLAKGVNELSTAMIGMNAIKTTEFTRLATNLEKIGAVSSASLSTASQSIHQFAQSLNSLAGVSITTQANQITELASAIRVLGLKSASNAIDNLPRLSTALNGLITTLSKAPRVSQSVIALTTALAQLANANGHITASGTTGRAKSFFDTITNGADRSTKSVKSLAFYFGKLYANFFILFRLFRKLGEAINLSSQLTELQNVVDVTFGHMAGKLDDMAKSSIETFGMSELTLKKTASRFQAMGSAIGVSDSAVKKSTEFLKSQNAIYDETVSSMADVSVQLTKLTADMASFYDVSQSEVADNLASIFTGTTKPLRKYGIDLTQATLKEWAMAQGLNADISKMSQAEKVMLRYQYVMAHTTNAMGDFARTADTWANQIRILKQNFQQLAIVIGNSMVNAFKPFIKAMNAVMAKVISFAQTVYNALGKIFGWKMEISNTGVSDELADAGASADDINDGLGGASKNAKKLKDNLLGIDELNIISPDDGDSGSGGGGLGGLGGALDDLEMQEGRTDSIFDKFKSDISSLWELGRWISDALAEAIENIDWDKIFRKADRFGKGLALFLNGLITPRLFRALGELIANSLNTALHVLDNFGETFGWEKFGYSLAEGLNKFFLTFDFSLLAHTINVWANGILDTIITFLEDVDWKMIGKQIGTFIAEIDFLEIGKKIGIAIWDAINAGVDLFRGAFSKAPFETIIITLGAIPLALKAIMGMGITKKVVSLAKNVGTLGKALGGSAEAMSVLGIGGKVIVDFATTAKSSFTGLGRAVGVFVNQARDTWDISKSLQSASQELGATMSGLSAIIVGAVASFAEFFAVKDAFRDYTLGVQSLTSAILEIVGVSALAGSALFVAFGPVGLAMGAVVGLVGAVVGLQEAFNELDTKALEDSISKVFTNPNGVNLTDAIGTIIDGTRDLGSSFDEISSHSAGLDTAQTNIKNTWLEIDRIKTSMENGVTSVEEGTALLKEQFEQMAVDASGSFTALETALMSALGEGSPIRETLIGLGYDVPSVINDGMGVAKQATDRITEITQQLAEINPVDNADEWYELTTELQQLTGVTDEVSQAMSDLKYEVMNNGISAEDIIKSDDITGAVQSVVDNIGSLGITLDTTSEQIENGYKSFYDNMEQYANTALAVGDSEAYNRFKNVMDEVPNAIESTKQQAGLEATALTDTLQNDLIGGIDQVIADAEGRWDEFNPVEKMLHGGNKDAFVYNQVNDYVNNVIKPISDEIETSLETMGIEGAGWASDASDAIVEGLFDIDVKSHQATLKDDYSEIISGACESVKDIVKQDNEEMGEWGATGYSEGWNKHTSDIEEAVTKALEAGIEAGKTAQDSHSPSEKYKELGQYAVEGYAQGIEDNKELAKESVRVWFEEMLAIMSGEDGVSPFDGLKLAWEEFTVWWNEEAIPNWMETQVKPYFSLENWLTIAEGFKKAIKQRWDEMSKQWQTDIKTWWTLHVEPWFTIEKWTKALEQVPIAFKNAFSTSANFAIDALNAVISGVENMVNSVIDAMMELSNALAQLPDVEIAFSASHISLSRIPAFATGGFPEDGLFFANHNELVGSFNGRNAVVNNEQIINGIALGIERVLDTRLVPYLSDIADYSKITSEKQTSVELDGRELVSAITSRNARNGFSF